MCNRGARASVVSLVVLIAISFFPFAGFAEQPRSGGAKKADSASADQSGRDSWYIGLGLGAGLVAEAKSDAYGTVTFDDAYKGAKDVSPKIGVNFKIGKTLSPSMLLGLDVTAVVQTAKDMQQQINNYFLMFTYFPAEEGLFIRLGGGLSSYASKTGSNSFDVSGTGFLGGVGYAFGSGKGATLTMNVDYSMQSYGSKGMKSSDFVIAYLGVDWY